MIQTKNSNKDILAKLMAQENITVIHKSVPTAYFDVKNRTLCCPILKEDMSPEMYDLFMGHEVSHGLNTPADGWHDAVCEKGSMFKGYLNVIEDVRIEKMIKSKYPGLRRSFYKGYSELATQDFFGTRGKDLQEYNLIDRINLYFKIGPFTQIEFSTEEQVYIERCNNLVTFEEVMELANELFEKQQKESKEKLESMTQEQLEELMKDLDISDDEPSESMSVELDESENDDNETDGQGSDANSEDEGDSSDEESETGEESQDSQEESDTSDEPSTEEEEEGGKSKEEKLEEELNKSKTDEESKENEQGLHKEENRYSEDPNYFELNDKIKYENFIVGYKTIEKDFENGDYYTDEIKSTVKSFQDDNKKIVGYMVKEFEMKKAASAYNRSWNAKSGELDMNKLAFYKLKEDIFNRVQVTPEGKNHGVVMALDWSGSMGGTVKSTMEQATLLSMFCRRLSIPFRLFAFSDNYDRTLNDRADRTSDKFEYLSDEWKKADKIDKQNFKDKQSVKTYGKIVNTTSEGSEWELGTLSLLEIYNDKQNPREFTKAMENWFQLASYLDGRRKWNSDGTTDYDTSWRCPSQLYLGGTPLDHTLMVMRDYLIDFKRNYNLDITSFITLTDGASHGVFGHNNPYLVDRKLNRVFQLQEKQGYIRGNTTHGLLRWIKATTGVNTIGFYLAGSTRDISYEARSFCGTPVDGYGEESNQKTKDFNKLSASFTDGCYDLAILINEKKIKIDVGLDEIVVDTGATKGQLKKALVKAGSNKMKQRVILNQFVGQMAV